MTAALYATRRAAARAFVGQALAKNKAWATLSYSYDYQEDTMLYLVWYDDNAKHTIELKITDAIIAYQNRYGSLPNVALVSEDDGAPATVAGVRTQVEKRISRNNVHVGYEAA